MNFKAFAEAILSEQDDSLNHVDIPPIPSEKLDLSEFYTFKITPNSTDQNITSPKRTFPFLQGKSDPTPAEHDKPLYAIYGDECTIQEALHYTKKAIDAIRNNVRRISTTNAARKIFSVLFKVPGVYYILRTGADTTILFKVDTVYLKKLRIQKELEKEKDLVGLEDLL